MVLAVAGILFAPETSPRTGRIGFQRLSVPAPARPIFITASTATFTGFAVMGSFTAVSPEFVAQVIGIGNHAVAGAIVGTVFWASAEAQIPGRRIEPQRAVAAGCAILFVGTVILAGALQFSSLSALIAASLVAGVGHGIGFSRGLAVVVARTPEDRRAEVSSTYFVVAYTAISLPVVGEGLVAQHWGLCAAGATFALAVAALAAVCFVAILVEEARQSRRAVAAESLSACTHAPR